MLDGVTDPVDLASCLDPLGGSWRYDAVEHSSEEICVDSLVWYGGWRAVKLLLMVELLSVSSVVVGRVIPGVVIANQGTIVASDWVVDAGPLFELDRV